MPNVPDSAKIEEHFFADDGEVPNNPALPLLVYRGVLEAGPHAAALCERLFARNGWGGAWRNGIYAHHHYHSTAHEVLGITAGSARVRLGGEGGKTVGLSAGDVVVIPAGVAHKSEGASPDLMVVGAYPGGRTPDMCKPGTQRHQHAVNNILTLPLPEHDPVYGRPGPLLDRWRAADRS
jgi:uncharacterized protein YjlB